MSDVIAAEEALTDATADEVLQFMRTSNPFAQHTWGWDMGRFIDWRWGSNAIRAAGNPDWFGDACRIFRRDTEIAAVSISEYGEDAEAIITATEDRELVDFVLRLLIERHRKRGDAIGLEFSDSAEWLRQVCRDAGLSEKPQSGCEWEYDLGSVETEVLLPEGFAIGTLRDAPRGTLTSASASSSLSTHRGIRSLPCAASKPTRCSGRS